MPGEVEFFPIGFGRGSVLALDLDDDGFRIRHHFSPSINPCGDVNDGFDGTHIGPNFDPVSSLRLLRVTEEANTYRETVRLLILWRWPFYPI